MRTLGDEATIGRVVKFCRPLRTVLMRWATKKRVLPAAHSSSARWMWASVAKSTALVLSSRMSTLGRVMSARAMAMRCFWPARKVDAALAQLRGRSRREIAR